MKPIAILTATVLVAVACAAPLHADPVDDAIRQGIDQLYNVRFDAAASSFERAISLDPNDPRGYFYRANVHLWSFLFDKREDQSALFFSVSDRAIKVAEARLDRNPRDSRTKMFLGMSYGYRAIANARSENIMAAALSAKTCYDQLTDVVQNDPRQYDAYLGLGLFHFMFGSVPKAASLVAGLGGIKGDANLGMREIELASKRGDYFRNDARLVIALLDIYYRNDLDRGARTLDQMARQYPRNIAILYALGSAYLDQNQPDKAVEYLDRVAKAGNSDFKTFTDLSYGRCGMAFFAKNDFSRARMYLQKFLQRGDEKMLRGFSWYILGLCFEFEGKRDLAVKAYQRVLKNPGFSSPENVFAQRKAREILKTPLTDVDKDLVRALNDVTASDFPGAVALARKVLAVSRLTPAQRAQAYYALGQGLQGQEKYGDAVDAFAEAIGSGNHTESWVAPYSYFHIAECRLKLGDKEGWKKNIERAKGFYGYDNEKPLRFKIERDVTMID